MHAPPRYIVISATSFDGTTPLDPTTLNPKTQNPGAGPFAVPSQNEPRTQVTIDGPIGRFSLASLLRISGTVPRPGLPALIRVRSITDPNNGTWLFRSANALEQPTSVGPLGIDQPLLPAFDLTQQWGEVRQAGPTDAVSVIMTPEGGDEAQIEIEVAELNAELAALWLAANKPCCGTSPSQARRSLAVTDATSPLSLAALSAAETIVQIQSQSATNVLALPTLPTDGSRVLKISNVGTLNVLIAPAVGQEVNGATTNYTLAPGAGIELQPFNATQGWHRVP